MTNEVRFREAEQRLWQSVGVIPTERRVHLDRLGVTVRVQEVGEGPPVLFVHGGSNGGTSWAQLIARLGGFHCVMLDRPGCGLSDPIPARMDRIEKLETFADSMIPDVLDGIGLARANVVATSYGGYFALRAAAAHPSRFERIVEFGWTIGAPMAKVPPLMRHTPTMRNELKATPRVITPIGGMNPRVLLSERLLAGIPTPILFLWGEEDPNGGVDIARPFVDLLPNADLELMSGAGHAPWIDDPDHAAAVTRRFLGL